MTALDTTGCAGPALPEEARPLFSLNGVAGGLDSYTAAPTADEMVRIDDLAKQLNDLIAELNRFAETDVANLNRQLREGGLQFLNPDKRVSRRSKEWFQVSGSKFQVYFVRGGDSRLREC